MASNALSRTENQDGTCFVQIMLSQKFFTLIFCTEKHKITLLALFPKHVDLACHPYTYFTCGVSFA